MIIASTGCSKHKIPGAPYDVFSATPTATAKYAVNIQVLCTQTPLANARVSLIYPDGTKTTTIAVTNNSGNCSFNINQYGTYSVEVSHTAVCKEPQFNSLVINQQNTSQAINIDWGTLTLTAAYPIAVTFPVSTYEYDFVLKYTSTASKRYNANGVMYLGDFGMNSQWSYVPQSYVENNGDSLTVKINIPVYFQPSTNPAHMQLAINNGDTSYTITYPTYFYQGWTFNPTTTSTTFHCDTGGVGNYGLESILYNVNINPTGLLTAQNICVKLLDCEFLIGGSWQDASYVGGTSTYIIVNTTSGMPYNLQYYNVSGHGTNADINGIYCFPSAGLYSFVIDYNNPYGPTATNARITLQFQDTNGNIILVRTYNL
jgi:hypothetical protein